MKNDFPSFSARVKTVWVLGSGPAAVATLGLVIARAAPCSRPMHRRHGRLVHFVGSGQVEGGVVRQANRTIVPLVNRILGLLGIAAHRFKVEIVNPSAASLQDTNVRVSGFSIDIALLVVMLAAALGVNIRGDVVLTGHIASAEGLIGMVCSVLAKYHAAQLDPEIQYFIYPCIDEATARSQATADQATRPIPTAGQAKIRAMPVKDIGQLLPLVFNEIELALASLRHGYHERPPQTVTEGCPVTRAALHLASGNDVRLWTGIELTLQAADSQAAASLLASYADYYLRQKRYPGGLGQRLRQFLLALPPWTRNHDICFPLLPLNTCLGLALLASASDHEDSLLLIDVVQGRQLAGVGDEKTTPSKPRFDADAAVRRALASISTEALAARISRPLNQARITCLLSRLEVRTHEEFHLVIKSTYRQLISHSQIKQLPVNDALVADEAYRLLRDTFAEEGGVQAAEAECRNANHGGLRWVIDRITDRLIEELKFLHVERVLREIVDPFNRKQKVQFMRALIEHLGNQLPNDVRRRPASDFVDKFEFLIRSYVRNRDHLVEAFRSV